MFLIVQTVLLLIAGVMLFRLWTAAAASADRDVRRIVAFGFLARAVVGQALFWISWAKLPIGRSLQLGHGLWFFAYDAEMYVELASRAVHQGVRALASYNATAPSIAYVKVLSVSMALFGDVASTGLLINLFCFLGVIAIARRWLIPTAPHGTGSKIVLAAFSASPGFVLWSLQPLKDSYFQFLFVAFVAACAVFHRALADAPGASRRRIAAGLLMSALLFSIAGIRWYIACLLLLTTTLFLFFCALQARRKTRIALEFLVVLFLLRTAIVLAARPYLPDSVTRLLIPYKRAEIVSAPSIAHEVITTREGFERSPAGTAIQPLLGAGAISGNSLSAAEEERVRAIFQALRVAWNRGDPRLRVDDLPFLPPEAATWLTRRRQERSALIFLNLRIVVMQSDLVTVSGNWRLNLADGTSRAGMFTSDVRRLPSGQWRIVPGPAHTPKVNSKTVQQHVARFVSGFGAATLPHFVGEWLGLFHVGGGRGLLWVVDLDTLVFDAILGYVVYVLIKRHSTLRHNPLFWLVGLTTVIAGALLIYSIANLGTLFRLRGMITTGLLLIPMLAPPAPPQPPPHSR